mmetsp:Transcript_41848/g.50729  ORF Transcript_41848/g.50729 Transcript_41848/m.50729 type:complete len:143 (-) Transcript_41848:84-512(-)
MDFGFNVFQNLAHCGQTPDQPAGALPGAADPGATPNLEADSDETTGVPVVQMVQTLQGQLRELEDKMNELQLSTGIRVKEALTQRDQCARDIKQLELEAEEVERCASTATQKLTERTLDANKLRIELCIAEEQAGLTFFFPP